MPKLSQPGTSFRGLVSLFTSLGVLLKFMLVKCALSKTHFEAWSLGELFASSRRFRNTLSDAEMGSNPKRSVTTHQKLKISAYQI